MQSSRFGEMQLAEILAEKLQSCYRYDKVHSNTNPGASRFRDCYVEWFGSEPLLAQPDIDLLVVDLGDLIGIELKYFKLDKGRFKRSYYEGIGQALALLRYGFDNVQLWHCFDQQVDEAIVARSWQNVHDLIYSLKLPIGYGALRVVKEGGEVALKEVLPSCTDPPLLEYDKPPNPRRFKVGNPLREETEAKRMREFIQHVLRIPQT